METSVANIVEIHIHRYLTGSAWPKAFDGT